MAGLLLLIVIGVWFAIAIKTAISISRPIKNEFKKNIVIFTAVAIIFVAPVTDDIIGSLQFSKYCGKERVKIYSSIPIGPEFYTESGSWLLSEHQPPVPSKEFDERVALSRKADSYVRWEYKNYVPMLGLLLISQRNTKIFAKESDELLAEWNSYSYEGGFLRRNILDGTNECHPDAMYGNLYEKLFHQVK